MKITEQQFRELLDRYLNNRASPEERDMLDRFFDSYKPGLSNRSLVEGDSKLQQEIFHRIQSRIAKSEDKTRNRFVRLWLPLAAAISFFVVAYFFLDQTNLSRERSPAAVVSQEMTAPGEKMLVRLSDGTKVHLNGDSKISYPQNFGKDTREVTLTGEGYFEVVKNRKPFVVHAHGIRTEVLGTSFNIKSREGDKVEVTLVEGKVNVAIDSGRSSVLKPNQQAVVTLASGDILTKEVNALRYVSWKDNILFFEQTSLKEAVCILEVWYAVKIEIENPVIEQCVITAKYQDEPLSNVLSSLQYLLNLEITVLNERHYRIKGHGCK